MGKDELQQHLEKGRYGVPQVNPDEQQKYLGTFKERCFLSMTIKEMRNTNYLASLEAEVKKHPNAFLLINGAVSESLQQRYLTFATKHQVDFTVVDRVPDEKEDQIGLLLVTDEAVNEPVIDVQEKYPAAEKQDAPAEKPDSFFKRLFH